MAHSEWNSNHMPDSGSNSFSSLCMFFPIAQRAMTQIPSPHTSTCAVTEESVLFAAHMLSFLNHRVCFGVTTSETIDLRSLICDMGSITMPGRPRRFTHKLAPTLTSWHSGSPNTTLVGACHPILSHPIHPDRSLPFSSFPI